MIDEGLSKEELEVLVKESQRKVCKNRYKFIGGALVPMVYASFVSLLCHYGFEDSQIAQTFTFAAYFGSYLGAKDDYFDVMSSYVHGIYENRSKVFEYKQELEMRK